MRQRFRLSCRRSPSVRTSATGVEKLSMQQPPCSDLLTPKTQASEEGGQSPLTFNTEDESTETKLAEEALKKKNLTRLKFYDLTNLPLVAILSRRQTSLVLLVRRKEEDPPVYAGTHGGNKPVVVKLFASKKDNVKHSVVLNEFESIRCSGDLNSSDRAFFRELVLLSTLQSDQDSAQGVVRLLGWGIAENYRGVVVEALGGPNLHDVIVKSTSTGKTASKVYSPPPHLRLLFRLHWAVQICSIVASVHRRGILHRDIRAENFAFRSPASDRAFGSIVLFDFDHGTFERRHCKNLKMAASRNVNTLAESSTLDTALTEFTTELVEEFGPAGAVQDASKLCLHWPTSPPPPAVTGSSFDAPEAAFCSGCAECPTECRAIDRSRAEACAQRNPRRIAFQARVECLSGANSDGRCACPLCECLGARVDSWSLGILVGQLFEVFSATGGVPKLAECQTCGQRLPLAADSIDRWATEVSQVIDQVALRSYKVAFDVSAISEVKPLMLCRPTSQSVSDFLHAQTSPVLPPARNVASLSVEAPTFRSEEEPARSKQHEKDYRELSKLTDWRRDWTRLSNTVRTTIMDLVQRSTSLSPRKRLTSAEMSKILRDLLEEVLRLHNQCQLMRLPISDMTYYD